MLEIVYRYRFVAVVACLGLASMLATAKGRLPLALRGIRKIILRKDMGRPAEAPGTTAAPIPAWKRGLAFVLVLLAFLIAVV